MDTHQCEGQAYVGVNAPTFVNEAANITRKTVPYLEGTSANHRSVPSRREYRVRGQAKHYGAMGLGTDHVHRYDRGRHQSSGLCQGQRATP
jgi:hypothetical protein